MAIQVFDTINAHHVATHYHRRTDLPDFHIFTVEDTYPHTRKAMPPHRMNFYQIVFLGNSEDAGLDMNADSLANLNDSLLFASPEHVLAWVRGEAQRGYILYFKADFWRIILEYLPMSFPIFGLIKVTLYEYLLSIKFFL